MIKNLPTYARTRRFVIYREKDGEKFFVGAYDDERKARMIAKLMHGKIC